MVHRTNLRFRVCFALNQIGVDGISCPSEFLRGEGGKNWKRCLRECRGSEGLRTAQDFSFKSIWSLCQINCCSTVYNASRSTINPNLTAASIQPHNFWAFRDGPTNEPNVVESTTTTRKPVDCTMVRMPARAVAQNFTKFFREFFRLARDQIYSCICAAAAVNLTSHDVWLVCSKAGHFKTNSKCLRKAYSTVIASAEGRLMHVLYVDMMLFRRAIRQARSLIREW